MIAAAIERVRATVAPGNCDTTATAETALTEIRKIENRRAEIVAFDNAHTQELQRLILECDKAGAAYQSAVAGRDIIKVRETLPKWVVLQLQADLYRTELGRITRDQTTDLGRIGKLKGEFPEMRGALLSACNVRLAEATTELERVVAQEQARLDKDYADAGYSAEESQPVRRQRSKVNWLGQIEKRIASENVESTWLAFAKELLKG